MKNPVNPVQKSAPLPMVRCPKCKKKQYLYGVRDLACIHCGAAVPRASKKCST